METSGQARQVVKEVLFQNRGLEKRNVYARDKKTSRSFKGV